MFLFAVMLACVLIPMIGLAIDGGMALVVQTQLQTSVDAAALAGAHSGSSAATAFFNANFPSAWLGTSVPSGQPNIAVSGTTATVSASVTAPLYFMRMFGLNTTTVYARAVASPGASTSCVYSLSTSGTRAFYGDATINMGCGLSISSSANDALHLDACCLTATAIQMNSSATYSVPSGALTPSTPTKVSSSYLTDPLSSTTLPTFSTCGHTNTNITTSQTLSPGTYCGGIQISNGASVTLNSGLYIITGGINWNAGSTVTGSNVTLFFTQGGGSTWGNITISSGNTHLTAPDNATSLSQGISGVLIATDRSWVDTSQKISINGGSNAYLQGEIYAPHLGVIFTGGNTNVTGKYFGIIADNIAVNGGANLTIPTPDYSSLANGSPLAGGSIYLTQ